MFFVTVKQRAISVCLCKNVFITFNYVDDNSVSLNVLVLRSKQFELALVCVAGAVKGQSAFVS